MFAYASMSRTYDDDGLQILILRHFIIVCSVYFIFGRAHRMDVVVLFYL